MVVKVPAEYRLAQDVSPSCVYRCLTPIGDVECSPVRVSTTTYCDTFDWRLFARGMSVSAGSGKCGPELQIFDHDRQETIAVVPGGVPSGFARDFPAGHVRDLVTDIIYVRRLLPQLEIIARRSPMTIRDKEGKIVLRLSFDSLKAKCPDGGRPVPLGRYLTVEPVRGYRKAMRKSGKLLQKRFAAKPCDLPVHIEGMRAIGITPGDYSSKLRLQLQPSMTAREASRLIHLNLLDSMRKNEQGAARNIDPEFLHDLRVAVRRTRSALSQLDKDVLPADIIARAKNEFRWIGQQTNRMRDMDVYLIDYPLLQSSLPKQYQAHLQPLEGYLLAQSRLELKNVARMIRSKRYRDICDHWHAYLLADIGTG